MADFTALQSQIVGKVTLPTDHGYNHATKMAWNGLMREKRPMAFVKVKGREDVAKTVTFCVENELDICVSCGCTSDFALDDNAVVIDLSQMSDVSVDSENKTAVVGGGARVCDVDSVTCKHGFVIPLASYSLLGVAGMTLLGGLGFLTPSYGCTSDNALEFEMVTCNGDVVNASEEEHPDLFWGLKGNGANFGIVTSKKFKLHDMPHWIVGGSLKYSASDADEVLKSVRDFYVKRNDNRLSIYMLLHLTASGFEVDVRLLFNGPVKDGGELVEDLQDCTFPRQNTCGPVHHQEFQARQGNTLYSPGRYFYGSEGHFLKELSDEVISNLVAAMDKVPHGSYKDFVDTTIYMTVQGGKLNEIPQEDSAFPFRSASFWIGMQGACANSKNLDDLKAWVDEVQEVNAAFGERPFGEHADEANAKFLALKQQYDPNNVFHHNINIRP